MGPRARRQDRPDPARRRSPASTAPRSFALPEFDPFWERVQEADVVVGMHASDSGYQRYINEWEGVRDGRCLPFDGRSGLRRHRRHQQPRPSTTPMASVIGHGLLTRFPTLRDRSRSRTAATGCARSLEHFEPGLRARSPQLFDEHPVDVFKRNIWVHPFHEDDPMGLIDLVGADHVLLRFRLPAPRGHVRPDQLRRRPRGAARRRHRQDHGRQPRRLMGIENTAAVA